ncbi:MAG TPA: SdpI family protein, partial [Chloroflexota bacterium]
TSQAAIALAAIASALAYPFLPRRVATHFDSDGRSDRSSSRVSAALMLPATMAGLMLLNDRLGAWPGSRDREDTDSSVQVRDEAIGLVELALLPSHLAILAKGLGVPVDMSRVQRAVYGVLLIALGNILPRLPRNGLVGIRTPWTLADPTVWERTHRLAGYLVAASGLVSLASLPASGRSATRIPMTATLGAVGISAIYSFVAYLRRSDFSR